MFAKENLVTFLAFAGCYSIIQAMLLIILGAILTGNEHYHQLFGLTIKHTGGGLIVTGVVYFLVAGLGLCTARTQNKFLLLVQVVILGVIVFLQALLGTVGLTATYAPISFQQQLSCTTVGLYNVMSEEERKTCDDFERSDMFAGTTLVWHSYFLNSMDAGPDRAMVLNFEAENFCCGNGLPLHCVTDLRSFPSSHLTTDIIYDMRQPCSTESKSYYLPSEECNEKGYCVYDLPRGICGDYPVTSTTRGCSSFIYSTLSYQVSVMAILVLVLLLFPATFILISLCLCYKRRDQDVVPTIDFASKVKIFSDG